MVSNCIKITGGGQTMRSRMYGTLDHLKKRLVQNGESKPQQYIRIPNSHANDTKLSESANSTIPSLSGSESIGYAQMCWVVAIACAANGWHQPLTIGSHHFHG